MFIPVYEVIISAQKDNQLSYYSTPNKLTMFPYFWTPDVLRASLTYRYSTHIVSSITNDVLSKPTHMTVILNSQQVNVCWKKKQPTICLPHTPSKETRLIRKNGLGYSNYGIFVF